MDGGRVNLGDQILQPIARDVVYIQDVTTCGGYPNALAESWAAVSRFVDLADQHVFRPGDTNNV